MLWRAAVLLAVGVCSASPSAWSRGTYGKLSFAGLPGSPSFSFSYGGAIWPSADLGKATDAASSSGTDPALGEWDELELVMGEAGSLAVRYYAGQDSFSWHRRPRTAELASGWPAFGAPSGANSSCLGWSSNYFFPGSTGTGPSCSSDGPAFFYATPTQQLPAPPAAAMVVSPMNYFSSNLVLNGCPKQPRPSDSCGLRVDAAQGGCERCRLYNTSALLLARPGLVRASRAFGSLMRQVWNTTRLRGPGVSQLSYWNDNQAGYSWWSVGPDQMVWGLPQEIYLKLKAGYDAAGIPIRGWEPDNNFQVDYKQPKNWIGRDLTSYNRTLYPLGGQAFVSALGNLSMTYYSNGFGSDMKSSMSFARKYPITKSNEPHPNASYSFYKDLLGYQASQLGAEMFFTDFLSYRGPAQQAYQDVPWGEEGEMLWLGGIATAAADVGMEVQFCMGAAHTITQSIMWPAVTNARVNGDGGLNTPGAVLPILLASTMGLGWSKDNLRTADRCYVAPQWPNGSIKYECNTGFKGENVNGQFAMQYQQTVLAALSLGPVGLSDQLSARPDNASAAITTNKTLAMATCGASGDLLQPSYPLTPVERMIIQAGGMGDCTGSKHRAYTYGCGTNLFGTCTAVRLSLDSDGGTGLWWTAVGFVDGRGELASHVTLYEADLAPMVDQQQLPSPSFGQVPRAAFTGEGVQFGHKDGYVVWEGALVHQAAGDCSHISVARWGGQINMTMPNGPRGRDDGAAIVYLAPVFGSVAMLGEPGKVAAVSTYRFQAVRVSTGGITAQLRGKPDEVVKIIFARRSEVNDNWSCVPTNTTIGADGTGSIIFR